MEGLIFGILRYFIYLPVLLPFLSACLKITQLALSRKKAISRVQMDAVLFFLTKFVLSELIV